jgi:hypothetical protein
MVNVQKSEIFPINCSNIDLPSILGAFQVQHGEFPCQYLGLPLQTGRLTRQDEHRLVDTGAARLTGWKGKMLNKTGRLTLVNSIMSSVVIYHMSVFPLSKWAIKRIDRIHNIFLWKGSEDARGGHCIVNWQQDFFMEGIGGCSGWALHCELAKSSKTEVFRRPWCDGSS